MPTDPRLSEGVCENSDPFNPPLQAWQTGGAGAGVASLLPAADEAAAAAAAARAVFASILLCMISLINIRSMSAETAR